MTVKIFGCANQLPLVLSRYSKHRELKGPDQLGLSEGSENSQPAPDVPLELLATLLWAAGMPPLYAASRFYLVSRFPPPWLTSREWEMRSCAPRSRLPAGYVASWLYRARSAVAVLQGLAIAERYNIYIYYILCIWHVYIYILYTFVILLYII